MKNHPLYKKLKAYVLTNLTTGEIEALSPHELIALLGEGQIRLSHTFVNNMKSAVIMAMENRDDENDLQQVKTKIKSWLDANFPNWEAERDREDGKPCIKIWLEGKP
jgi:hypothetical protein